MLASASPRRRLPALLGAVTLALALGGGLAACGSETSDSAGQASEPSASATDSESASESPSESPSESTSESPSESATAPADAPSCAKTWTEGGVIPRAYAGCVEDDGTYVKADRLGCSSGQRMVMYGDRFYGVAGGEIHMTSGPLQKDRDYQAAVRRCRA